MVTSLITKDEVCIARWTSQEYPGRYFKFFTIKLFMLAIA